MSELPPGLEEFGLRLRDAAARDVEERRRAHRRRRLRNLGLPLAAALVTAGVSAGAALVGDNGGAPIPSTPDAGSLGAAKDPAVVVASAVRDPAGGPPWVVRAYTNPAGRECVQIGRLRDGVFGQVVAGSFHALPASAPGTACATLGARRPFIVSERRGATRLTLVYGLAAGQAPLTVRVGDRTRTAKPAGFGAFVAVVPGAGRDDLVVVRWRDGGRIHTRRIGFPSPAARSG
ncbi:MAG: hypothetical protein QOJ35_1511 [Solirubrobacteraceae bacterium]|jgi:hypothetical protein|nr:hypothetical protein [Solirubrobacteraceae bacterium]